MSGPQPPLDGSEGSADGSAGSEYSYDALDELLERYTLTFKPEYCIKACKRYRAGAKCSEASTLSRFAPGPGQRSNLINKVCRAG